MGVALVVRITDLPGTVATDVHTIASCYRLRTRIGGLADVPIARPRGINLQGEAQPLAFEPERGLSQG